MSVQKAIDRLNLPEDEKSLLTLLKSTYPKINIYHLLAFSKWILAKDHTFQPFETLEDFKENQFIFLSTESITCTVLKCKIDFYQYRNIRTYYEFVDYENEIYRIHKINADHIKNKWNLWVITCKSKNQSWMYVGKRKQPVNKITEVQKQYRPILPNRPILLQQNFLYRCLSNTTGRKRQHYDGIQNLTQKNISIDELQSNFTVFIDPSMDSFWNTLENSLQSEVSDTSLDSVFSENTDPSINVFWNTLENSLPNEVSVDPLESVFSESVDYSMDSFWNTMEISFTENKIPEKLIIDPLEPFDQEYLDILNDWNESTIF